MFNFSHLLTQASTTFFIFIYFQFLLTLHQRERKKAHDHRKRKRKRKRKKYLEEIKVFFLRERNKRVKLSSELNISHSISESKFLYDKISLLKNFLNCITFFNYDKKFLDIICIHFERK